MGSRKRSCCLLLILQQHLLSIIAHFDFVYTALSVLKSETNGVCIFSPVKNTRQDFIDIWTEQAFILLVESLSLLAVCSITSCEMIARTSV